MSIKRLRLNGPLMISLLLMAGLVILLILPAIAPLRHPQMAQIVAEVNGRVKVPPFSPGEAGFFLGTDVLGRDLLSRLIYGARYTLGIALCISLVRALLAVPLGLLAGWHGGWLARFTQGAGAGFGAIPALVLVGLTLSGIQSFVTESGPGLLVYGGVLVVAGFPRMAEHVRQRAQEVALLPHIESAVAMGAAPGRIIWRHVLPLMSADILMMLATEMAWVLLMIGQLAVFGIYVGGWAALPGLGGGPTNVSEYWPEWGMMMGRTRSAILSKAWLPLLPGMALGLTAVAFHLMAEGLRLRWARH